MDKQTVTLTKKDERKLVAIVTRGYNKASYIQRAHFLLKSAPERTDTEIANWLYIRESAVRRAQIRFTERCSGRQVRTKTGTVPQ